MSDKRREIWEKYGRRLNGENTPRVSLDEVVSHGVRPERRGPHDTTSTDQARRYFEPTFDGTDGRLTFGKHRGRLVSELAATEDGFKYLSWCLTKQFPGEFLALVNEHTSRRAG